MGRKTQQPFSMDYARKNCEDWRNTEARMANAEASSRRSARCT